MHDIHDIRLSGNDLVDRAHSGTDHLRGLFATATEATVGTFVETQLALVDEITSDLMATLAMSRVFENKRPAAHVRKVISRLDDARSHQGGMREAIGSVLAMRKAAEKLARILGPDAADFLAPQTVPQSYTRDHIDLFLQDHANALRNARQQCSAILSEKDRRIVEALIAIEDVRCIMLLMLCHHPRADEAYVFAVELLTGVKQPMPYVSTLLHKKVETASVHKMIPGTSLLPPDLRPAARA